MPPNIVILGAGKIGRSFIGQLFGLGGYEVVFIDNDHHLVDALNHRGEYRVLIKGGKDITLTVRGVRAIHAGDPEAVAEAIAGASIMAVSVGMSALPSVMPLLAGGLMKRQESRPGEALDIILAENMRQASGYFRQQLSPLLPPDFPFVRLVGLVETSIGKMVPVMRRRDQEEDPLRVFAEPYNTLILDKKAFLNPIPDIDGLDAKENMAAWVDRKLFIHNLGHAAAAYLGYLYKPAMIHLYEALAVPEICHFVRETMLQAAFALFLKYPSDFSMTSLSEHIDDLLERFQNKNLGDTVFRVGCDLKRKLSPDDRLTGAVRLAQDTQQAFDRILFVLVCACRFAARDEDGNLFPGDDKILQMIEDNDLKNILLNICGFDEHQDRDLILKAIELNASLAEKGIRALLARQK